MSRLRLKYKCIGEIVGSDGLAIVTLTDEPETRALNIVCDKAMRHQLQMRTGHLDICNSLLPEVLAMMLGDYVQVKRLEVTIYDIVDGQYKATLLNPDNFSLRQIRLSDAILLHFIAGVPLYIDEQLMNAQSVPFDEKQTRISIPLNTLETDKLKEELERAVEEEDYRLASYIQEELNKRKNRSLNPSETDQES